MNELRNHSAEAKELLSNAELYEIKAGKTDFTIGNECKSICTQCIICPPACTVCTTNVKSIFKKN